MLQGYQLTFILHLFSYEIFGDLSRTTSTRSIHYCEGALLLLLPSRTFVEPNLIIRHKSPIIVNPSFSLLFTLGMRLILLEYQRLKNETTGIIMFNICFIDNLVRYDNSRVDTQLLSTPRNINFAPLLSEDNATTPSLLSQRKKL